MNNTNIAGTFFLVQDDAWGIGAQDANDLDGPVMGPQCFNTDQWAAIVAADGADVAV